MSPKFQPLDRLAVSAIAILVILIALLLWQGDRTAPYVRDFSWQNRLVRADDTAFTLTFSRPMNHASVEANLNLEPPLPGKFSWAGRRMAYTLAAPAVYGKTYKLSIADANDSFTKEVGDRPPFKTFEAKFSSPDPAFAYIGNQGEETGRLVVYNFAQAQKQILTPANLTVLDFRVYSDRSKILLAAVPQTSQPINPLTQKLYTVDLGDRQKPIPKLVLDSGDYQNFKFDLAADGKLIVAQRLSRVTPGNYGLWIIKEGEPPKPINNPPGGDFLITPDSSSVAIAQGEGVAILPLAENQKPLDFLPKFGMVLSFSKDGSQAAMIKFNKDYTRSLFQVTNQGVQTELIKIKGSILSAQFDPQKQNLYCLLTDVIQTPKSYQETPYLAVINLQTKALTRILNLPKQQGQSQISISPDGTGLLFDYVQKAIAVGKSSKNLDTRITLLSINPIQAKDLEIFGSRPQWLP